MFVMKNSFEKYIELEELSDFNRILIYLKLIIIKLMSSQAPYNDVDSWAYHPPVSL